MSGSGVAIGDGLDISSGPFHLFAYGSMTEGMVHFQKIQEFVRHSEGGLVKGSVFRLRVGFPVVLEKGSDLVPGQLLTVEASPFLIELLDRFHGVNDLDPIKGLFYRRQVPVYDPNPEKPEKLAWIYFLNPDRLTSDAVEIKGGQWRSDEPTLTDLLTERQKQYILRLGASTGREIIPIDLALYRELMNLEMIVDKGRRLALTKLGHEVFRYLR